jgi:hypothetical protein
MKLFQLFTKTPNYKKFNYVPRYYNPEEEERKERNERIKREVNAAVQAPIEEPAPPATYSGYQSRIRGSFNKARDAKGAASSDTSPMLIRLALLLVLTVGLIGYLQYGMAAVFGVALVIIPMFLYLKFRKLSDKGR